jgi:hypothetical protein
LLFQKIFHGFITTRLRFKFFDPARDLKYHGNQKQIHRHYRYYLQGNPFFIGKTIDLNCQLEFFQLPAKE